jgi:hypothetical protein
VGRCGIDSPPDSGQVSVVVSSEHGTDLSGRPERLWGTPSLLSNGYEGSFPGVKAAGA